LQGCCFDFAMSSCAACNEHRVQESAYTATAGRARLPRKHQLTVAQKCETLQGHDQQRCKDQADADYEAAKANAKATKIAQQP
jgi:hypothetical protein